MKNEKSQLQKHIKFDLKLNKDNKNRFSVNQLKLQTTTQLKLKDFSKNISHVSPFQKSLSLKNWNKGNKILPALNMALSHRQRSSPKSQFQMPQLLAKSQTVFKIKSPMLKQNPEEVIFNYQNLNQNVNLKNNLWQLQNTREKKNSFKSKQIVSKTVYKWKQLEKRNINIKRKDQIYTKKVQQSPNQLITRKLEWDGKQTKKIDRNQIHLKLLKHIEQKKLVKDKIVKGTWLPIKQVIDLKNLNGWQQEERGW